LKYELLVLIQAGQHLELPGQSSHDIDGISAANTHSAHAEASSVDRVAVGQ
jgi:hypothetical protein